MAYIDIKNIRKTYEIGGVQIHAVSGINIQIQRGSFNVIVGPSGAGKTTVMNILGGMDTPTSGTVVVDGKGITRQSDRELTKYRRDDVGFVFQSYNLIPNLTALENVELATQICKDAKDPIETLEQVGLGDRLNNFPSQMSGGEQQRVAIARAIAKNPKLLLCDEPTGALDTETGKQVLKVLQECAQVYGMTVVIITHNSIITQMADCVFEIKNGQVENTYHNQHIKHVDEISW
ncbi:macrolide ABC transporter ATP-binding protein [Erysipelothrix larvae]|uniref:Macrolide ABC transporter ATP-binding protein n=1 Tax=Erysipelothrix larvae TaxID=1514105 RepID=A0A0X8GZ39_9FIRM|nr:ABC transporter ATP-binding protein [Erysipelothrix larvae]AMC93066.1 macrolide ABC transporter ATP-binding protein [Erysipelothrix larvae]